MITKECHDRKGMSCKCATKQLVSNIEDRRSSKNMYTAKQMRFNTGFNRVRILCGGLLYCYIVVIVVGLKVPNILQIPMYNTLYVHGILCITKKNKYEWKRLVYKPSYTARYIHHVSRRPKIILCNINI